MIALSVNPEINKIEELDLQMRADTLYSFFKSILIDESESIKEHIIYSDANALSEGKKAYFIGEQLIFGEALVFGRYDFDDVDVKIKKAELSDLINYNIGSFYEDVLKLLQNTDIHIYRSFEVEKNGEKIALDAQWVLYTFNIADDKTKEYFINELKKIIDTKECVDDYMQRMAQLAMNAAQ